MRSTTQKAPLALGRAMVQSCIIHLICSRFRLTSRRYWDEAKRDLKPIYTAVNATAARAAFDELAENWGPATQL